MVRLTFSSVSHREASLKQEASCVIWYSIAANKNESRQTLKYRGNLTDDSGIYHPVCTLISK